MLVKRIASVILPALMGLGVFAGTGGSQAFANYDAMGNACAMGNQYYGMGHMNGSLTAYTTNTQQNSANQYRMGYLQGFIVGFQQGSNGSQQYNQQLGNG